MRILELRLVLVCVRCFRIEVSECVASYKGSSEVYLFMQ